MKPGAYLVRFGIDASASPESHDRQRLLADMANHTMDQIMPMVLRQVQLMPDSSSGTLIAINAAAGLAAQMAALCAQTAKACGSTPEDALNFYEAVMGNAHDCFHSVRLQTLEELRVYFAKQPAIKTEGISS